MVDFAPAEISAVEQYEASLAEAAERKAIRRRQLEVDRVELKRKIKEAVEDFDEKLLDLYKTRLAIEKCILAEELLEEKILSQPAILVLDFWSCKFPD